jgi:tetratricopeptide (TPR) repeat protein
MKNTKYDKAVFDYLHSNNGYIFYLGENSSFFKLLKITVTKYIGATLDRIIFASNDLDLYSKLKRCDSNNIIFVFDMIFSNSFVTSILGTISSNFKNVKTIIVTTETHKNILALYHELGAKNFVIKPVSVDVLVEKLSNVIEPHGELSELIDKAKTNMEFGKYDVAQLIVEQILSKKPNSPTGNILYGDIELYHLNNPDKAIEYYDLAHRQSVLYLEPIKKLAEAYSVKNDTDKVLKYLNKLERLSPLNTQRKMQIGKINLDLGKVDVAESYFNEAIKLAAQDAIHEIVVLVKKIAEMTEEKNPDLALKYYSRAIAYRNNEYEDSDIEVFNKLGIIYRKQGKWRDAIREYEKAITIKKNDEGLYYNIAMAYAEGGEFKSSSSFLEKALAINGKFGEGNKSIIKNIFRVFQKSGRKDSAEYFALKVLDLDNMDIDAKKYLGQ